MSNLALYYADQEPTDVVQFAGHERTFVVYDPAFIDEIAMRLTEGVKADTLYREVCALSLAGDARVKALPKDSPPWFCEHGKWRPLDGG